MPKKQQKNAFFFYMQDKMQEFQRAGYTVHSISDCVPLAHPKWKAEPEDVKKKYEAKAKAYKQKMRHMEPEGRLDNTGKPISEYQNPDDVLDQNRRMARVDIARLLPSGDRVTEEKFYLIHFEYLLYYEDLDEFYPAEIALAEYSIFSGIHRTYHKFIKPAEIPKGWKFDAKTRSEQRHKLPYDQGEPFDQWDDDYYGIWNQICNFVNPDGREPNYPPIFCLMDEYKNNATAKCLEWVHKHARLMVKGLPSNKLEKVYALEDLILSLFDKSRSDKLAVKPSEASVHDELRVTKWDFEPDTCCAFHEEKECKFCSIGFVRRWAYAISDFLKGVEAFQFDLTENHVPLKSAPAWATSHSQKHKSSSSSAIRLASDHGNSSESSFHNDESRRFHDADRSGGGSGEFDSGYFGNSSEQPRLVQQSMGRGSTQEDWNAVGRGFPSSAASSAPKWGRGRGNFVSDPAFMTNSWGSSMSGGRGQALRPDNDYPSLGGGGGAEGGGRRAEGGRGAGMGVGRNNGWGAARGRGGPTERNYSVGRGAGTESLAHWSGNNFWSSMGRGRGGLDPEWDKPSVVGRGRGYNVASSNEASRLPPGFPSNEIDTRGANSMKVVRSRPRPQPPPGFTDQQPGGGGGIRREDDGWGGVEGLERRMNGMNVYEEDWS